MAGRLVGQLRFNQILELHMKRLRILAIVLAISAVFGGTALVSAKGPNGSGGVTGPAFYVDGELYRTVGTPTDFSHTGAPAHSYDTIYGINIEGQPIEGQPNVATAAPGDRNYNGGRWQVIPVTFVDSDAYDNALDEHDLNNSGDFDSEAEINLVVDDEDNDYAQFGDVIASFECPVIPLPRGKNK